MKTIRSWFLRWSPFARGASSAHRALVLVLVFLPALIWGCSSTSASHPDAVGRPALIRFVSGASRQTFQLVNETHTGRVELYSSTRTNADTKVQTDDVLDEVLDHFAKLGLFERTQPGNAPQSEGAHSGTLEVDVAGEPVYFAVGPTSTVEDRTLFAKCMQTFLLVYNQTYQLQSVERQPDWGPSLPTNR